MSKWPMMPLREVLYPFQEYIDAPEAKEYPKLSVKLYGKGVVLDTPADGSTLKMKRHQIAKSGQVILSEIWGKKGAIGFVPAEGNGALCTSHFFLFDVHRNKLEPKYLQAIFTANYLQDQLDVEAKGTTGYAAVRPKNLLAAEIPLPPLAEQRRIVARIEALAAKIGEARSLRTESDGEVKSLARSAADAVYKDLSCRYGRRALAELCQSITDGDHLTPLFSQEGVKFIFVGNVSSGQLHFEGCKHVAPGYFASLKPQRVPGPGDILYSAVGATLGVPAIVETDEPFCFQRHVAILKPNPTMLLTKFGWHMLQSRTVFDRAWASATGSAQPTVPLRAIRVLEVPAAPVKEQRRIIAYLDDLEAKVDALKKLQSETAAKLAALLPSILDKAFKGEL